MEEKDYKEPEVYVKEISQLDRIESDNSNLNDALSKFLGISNDAKDSDLHDKQMTAWEALKMYPKATMWSVVLSTALIMEGYDTHLLGAFFAVPAFQKKYGFKTKKGRYEVAAKWQTGLNMGCNVGEIIGLLIAGFFADRFGYRKTLYTTLVFTFGFIFILFFAPSVEILLLGEILCGICWGVFQTLTVSYAYEVCPMVLRYTLTSYVNLCWVFGKLISNGVLKAYSTDKTANAYRVPFAIQWIWPLPVAIGIYFAPESPWLLIKKGRASDAKKALKRLITNATDDRILDIMVKKMKITTEEEAREGESTTYAECFKGNNWRRTRITSLTCLTQCLCGHVLVGSSTYFLVQAGVPSSLSFTLSIVTSALGIFAGIASWFAAGYFGRFTMYFGGMCFQTVMLLLIGGMGFTKEKDVKYAIGVLLIFFSFTYDFTVGPVCYCITAEIPNSRLRTKTLILAKILYNIFGIVNAVWVPLMLNSTKWNWGAKSGLFWAGWSILFTVWMWCELPETKDRTIGEIDALFEMGIKSRDFKKTEVDPYDSARLMSRLNKEQIKRLVEDEEISDDHSVSA